MHSTNPLFRAGEHTHITLSLKPSPWRTCPFLATLLLWGLPPLLLSQLRLDGEALASREGL